MTTPNLSVIIIFVIFGGNIAEESIYFPPNPCPHIYSFVRHSNGAIMGMITLPNNGEGYIDLEINVSISTNSEPSFNLNFPKQELTDCKKGIAYLFVPYSNNLPRITRVYYNGNVICSGPQEPLITGGRTVWNAQHKGSYGTKNSESFTCPNTERPADFVKPQIIKDRFTEDSPQSAVPRGNYCGISKGMSQVTPLSLGGQDVSVGEFPWAAALMHGTDDSVITFACSATLVSLRYVITTGHCIELSDEEELLVVLGTKDIGKRFWFLNGITRKVSKITLHPDFQSRKVNNDIALIKMDKDLTYTPGSIVPICLWHGSSDTNDNSLDELILRNPGTVVGFGDTNTRTKRLNKVQSPVVNHLRCLESSTLPVKLLEGATFCAGYRDGVRGACSTDIGASFGVQKMNRNGAWYLRGVLSGYPERKGMCNLNGYSLYVDLAEHYDWIHNIIT